MSLPEKLEAIGRLLDEASSEDAPGLANGDPGLPSGPGALEPAAESDTMRRLRENMGRYRHRI